jgi:hypothetical protein
MRMDLNSVEIFSQMTENRRDERRRKRNNYTRRTVHLFNVSDVMRIDCQILE